jgi:large subunit ribosomal protein L15
MPIQRRIPKIGFKNNDRVEYKVFNLGQIETLIEKYSLASFSMEDLYVNGLVNRTDKVKILGNGAISTKIDFKVNAISEKAKAVIEAAGGSVEIIK